MDPANASDAETAPQTPRRRRFMHVDAESSAILDQRIAHHARSAEIGARLSRAQMLHYLVGRAVACTCGSGGGGGGEPSPPLEPPSTALAKRRIVEVYPAVLRLLDEEIQREEQDVRVGVRFNRPQMLRRLVLRAGRCRCAPGAERAGGPHAWHVARAGTNDETDGGKPKR
jgi:hypothetical protein